MSAPIVLNTRPRGQAAELSKLLTAAGFAAVEAPAIEVVRAWDAADLSAAREGLRAGRFGWVILASQNAGRSLVGDLGQVRVVCGTATANAFGLQPDVRLDRFSAAAALDALGPRLTPGDHILAPRAAEGRDELIEGLQALGVDVTAPVAYRTVATDTVALTSALRGRLFDAITVCSPSALAALLSADLRPELESSALVCLGETTADAARAAGLRVAGVAASTSMPALVAAVATVVQSEAAA